MDCASRIREFQEEVRKAQALAEDAQQQTANVHSVLKSKLDATQIQLHKEKEVAQNHRISLARHWEEIQRLKCETKQKDRKIAEWEQYIPGLQQSHREECMKIQAEVTERESKLARVEAELAEVLATTSDVGVYEGSSSRPAALDSAAGEAQRAVQDLAYKLFRRLKEAQALRQVAHHQRLQGFEFERDVLTSSMALNASFPD